nr:hypothetical protein [Tanacetum cinerariifolium]
FDKTPYELMNKRKPNIKFFHVFGCRCYLLNDYEDVGKLKAKGDIGVLVGYSKESAAFRIYNKRTRKIQESVNVNFDEISKIDSKQFSLEPGLSKLNELGKSSNPSVSQVSEASKKYLEDLFQDFYDEYFDSSKIMKSSTTNVETLINDEVFHEVSESFQGESSSSSLNDDVQQSMEATKDHPLHKIIGDPKSSVRTRGQLANSCLFSCLLSFIEPANVAEALRDADWVIGLGYTLMFLTHSDEDLEIEKFKRSRENKIEFAYDYGNLNANYVNEKINFKDDYFQDIINPDFEKIDSPFQQTSSLKPYVSNVILKKIIIDLEDEVVNLLEKEQVNLETIESLKSKSFESSEKVCSESENQSKNDCLVIEKECDKEENRKVIAPVIFKLNVSHCVSPISTSKSSCDSNNVEIKFKRKRRKRKSSKQNVKQVDNDVSRANNDFVHFSNLVTFSSVRRPKNSGVIWKKKGSSNTSNVGLSAVSISNLNKNVKRYSRKDLLACNNSHLGDTRSDFVCNDAMNVSCDSRMCDLLDDNNLFIFDDVNARISLVSKMPFRKKPCDSMHICLWIIDSGCSKHMTGNHALLTNFMEKLLETVRFGNNDFAVITGYGDVVNGLPKMKFEKDHLCSVCKQGKINQKHHKSKTDFTLNKPLYLLHMDLCGPIHVQSINGKRYVLVVVDDYSRTPQENGVVERRNRTLVEAARTMLTFANLPSFLWAEAIATA